jgi:LPS-assembly protein
MTAWRLLSSLLLLAGAPLSAWAEDNDDPVKLRLSEYLSPAPPPKPNQKREQPLIVDANRLQSQDGRYVEASGQVRIRDRRDRFEADWLRYDKETDELTAKGNVVVGRDEDTLRGADVRLRVEERVGVMNSLGYEIARVKGRLGRGTATLARFEGRDRYALEDATYTTCEGDKPDWLFKAKDLRLDYKTSIGAARQVSVEYLGTPILYTPWVDFALDNNRKTGFLAPSYGVSDQRGLELSVPWYWNIATNRDATIAPRLMTKRGLEIGGQYRYLESNHSGQMDMALLPHDAVTGDLRYHALIQHSQQFTPRLSGRVVLEDVSDDTYFADLSSEIAKTSQVNLPRDLSLYYDSGWWNLSGRLQGYETLQNPSSPNIALQPHQRLPQFLLNASRADLPYGLKFDMTGEFVRFDHDAASKAAGNRIHAYPSLSLPYENNYGNLTAKVGWYLTRYDLDRNPDAPTLTERTRSMPMFSLDGGVIMERDWEWRGKSYTQTLEPRAYFVYIPYRDQNGLPVFDSGTADLSLTRLFSENQFVGIDRINDANQLTLAVTSRIIEPSSGLERLRVTLGQRYYFEDQRVTLPGVVAVGGNLTDLLAQVSGQITDQWWLASGLQFNPDDGALVRANLGATYRVGPGRRVNADFRFINNDYAPGINQLDVSWQWPLKARWYSLGRINYSFRDSTLVEGLIGFEYNAGCWMWRGVAQRLVTATGETSNAFYLQLELNGLTALGPNPLDVLKRNISGYQKSDEIE